jgi:hypothetical protein
MLNYYLFQKLKFIRMDKFSHLNNILTVHMLQLIFFSIFFTRSNHLKLACSQFKMIKKKKKKLRRPEQKKQACG